MKVFVHKDGKRYGPFTLVQLRQYVKQGNFATTDRACHDSRNWVTIAEVPGFAGMEKPVATQSPTVPREDLDVHEQTVELQPAPDEASNRASKKKKVILWSSIGWIAALLVTGLIIWLFGSNETVRDSKKNEAQAESKPKSGETSPAKSPEIVKIDLDDNETRNKIIDEAMWESWAFELSLTERIRNEMMTALKNGEVLSVRGKKGEELYFLPNKITPYTGWSKYVEDGRTTVSQIKDGKPEGLSAGWHENGQKEREVNLKDGKLDGFSTRWYENGQKKSESSYEDGKLVTAVVWKPNGEKCPETNVVNGNGVWLSYSFGVVANGRRTYEDGIQVYRGYDGTFVVRTKKEADDDAPSKTNANTQFFEESDSLIKSISNLDEIIEEAIDSQKIRHEGNDEKRLAYVAYGSLQQTPYSGWVKKLYFRPNGQLQSLAQLKNGKADGLAFFWYRNGQLQLEGKYKDGKLSTAVAWKHNGEKCPDTNLKNGNGVVVRYNRGGSKRETYKDGEQFNLAQLKAEEKWGTDLEPYGGVEALTKIMKAQESGDTKLFLTGRGSNKIIDISPLKELVGLKKLYLDNNEIQEIAPLSGLTNLEELDLGRNQITDISPLKDLTKLEVLKLGSNQITELSPLIGMTNLKELHCWGNKIIDIEALASLTKLEKLYLVGNRISDLTPLRGLTGLENLQLSNNRISDLTPLAELTKLKRLWIDRNSLMPGQGAMLVKALRDCQILF